MRADVPVATVQLFSNWSKPLAFTTTVPEPCGTCSNLNSPEESVVVEAVYEPACSSTCAPAIESPLESRTVPSTRNSCARATGIIEPRSASVISARRQIRPRTVKAGGRKIARLDMTCDYFHGLNEIRMLCIH